MRQEIFREDNIHKSCIKRKTSEVESINPSLCSNFQGENLPSNVVFNQREMVFVSRGFTSHLQWPACILGRGERIPSEFLECNFPNSCFEYLDQQSLFVQTFKLESIDTRAWNLQTFPNCNECIYLCINQEYLVKAILISHKPKSKSQTLPKTKFGSSI